MKQIKIYSFFSGCGLLDLGMEMAGFKIAMVSEKYLPFLKAYKYSREKMKIEEPEHGYFNDDIADYLQENSVLEKYIKVDRKNNIIGFVGGPPCPDFSTAGKNRGVKGDNGKLTITYFDLIAKMEPDFFIFENVKGLWKTKKHKEFYDKMYRKMKRKGYYIVDKLVNSLEYGVPQERERVIMIGIKCVGKAKKDKIQDLVQNFNWGVSKYNSIDVIKNMEWPITDRFDEQGIRIEPEGIDRELTIQYWFERNSVEQHANANDYFKPKAGLVRMKTIDEGDVSRKSYKRLHRWRYSPTAAYGNNEVHLHPYRARRLSVAEVLAIQSVPKEFELPHDMSLTDMFKTVGNGVPVLMAEKIAIELKKLLEAYFT
ncbi:MAG: DNA cytosine methyltransferase [Suilimivivens sp.]